MSTCRAASGEQCPQCAQADLRPYGNGSKWACPRCYFVLPCCEGGDLAGPTAAGPVRAAAAPATAGPARDGRGPLPPR